MGTITISNSRQATISVMVSSLNLEDNNAGKDDSSRWTRAVAVIDSQMSELHARIVCVKAEFGERMKLDGMWVARHQQEYQGGSHICIHPHIRRKRAEKGGIGKRGPVVVKTESDQELARACKEETARILHDEPAEESDDEWYLEQRKAIAQAVEETSDRPGPTSHSASTSAQKRETTTQRPTSPPIQHLYPHFRRRLVPLLPSRCHHYNC
ncbi:hypothetical protein EV363DRAFT_1422328 [Boletus edulis]|nr:hypothetical protein EV363DRAFT_1422328 [Boletus edulis]